MSYLDRSNAYNEIGCAAFFLSVVGGSVITSVGLIIYSLVVAGASGLVGSAMLLVFGVLLSSAIGAIPAFFIGLPLTYLLARYRLERVWVYPLAGTLAGALTGWLLFGSPIDNGALGVVLFSAVPGFFAGLIWWFSYRRHEREVSV